MADQSPHVGDDRLRAAPPAASGGRHVHRTLHRRALVDRTPDLDVVQLRKAVDRELHHRELGWLFRWSLKRGGKSHAREVEVSIAHAVFVLGLPEKTRRAALRGEVGQWTQRKIRNPKLRSPADRIRERKRKKIEQAWRSKHRVKTPEVMYDSVDVDEIPPTAEAVLGYTGGTWPTYHELEHRFPNARVVSIAIAADEDADLLDVEIGDATPEQSADWYARQQHRRKTDPGFYNLERNGVYAAVSQLVEVIGHMRGSGHKDSAWIPMSAHTGEGKHLCGPHSCRYPGLTITVPCTQFDWSALGRNLDESVVARGFWH
jgi:hypothetical protein